MSSKFDYDVFLSYNSKDKNIVHALAERLKKDGLRVWLDRWMILLGDMISLKIQSGLELSRTLILCMSSAYFESVWGTLEHHTLLFRDPTNSQRRFIPLLIEDCTLPDMIAQFLYVDWRTPSDENYRKLLAACRGTETRAAEPPAEEEQIDQSRMILKGHSKPVWGVAITPDGKTIISGSEDNNLKVWNLETGRFRATFKGHTDEVNSVAVTLDGKTVVSGSADKTVKVWDIETGKCRATFEGHSSLIYGVAVTPDGKTVVSGSFDNTLKVWDIETGECCATFKGHTNSVWGVAITPDGKTVVSGSWDNKLKVWDIETGQCRATFEGHTNPVWGVAITPDGKTVVSGSDDNTLKVWDIEIDQCRATFEGHTGSVYCVAVTPDGKTVVSATEDKTLKVWDIETGECHATYIGHSDGVLGVAITPDGKTVISGSTDRTLRVWDLPEAIIEPAEAARYTNAKVVLVGESGVGKTGLALRLAEGRWEETGSTHGMNVWQLNLPNLKTADMEREVWLWDFAGQPDYRLIHQLYMDETALAVMVIDPQKDDPFEPLGHWEKAVTAAVRHDPARLLVAGRCDRGGLTISQTKVDRYREEHGYSGFLNTASKTDDGCEALKVSIAEHIPWDRLSWTATTRLFKTLKDAILQIKNEDRVLARVSELGQRLQLQLPDESFKEDELRTVVGLLAGQGIIQKVDFGDFVLLQPKQINNYASVIVRSARENADEIGSVPERDILEADLDFKDMKRLDEADEKILLRAMLQTLIDRSLCLRVETDEGTQLVFPSYFKQDRPEIPEQPNVVVTYAFSGTLDEIYSTLVVRLHYTNDFEMDELWRYAADFKTLGNGRAGLMLTKKSDTAEIKVYFEENVPVETRVSFIKYVHEHLKKYADDVTRVRSYVCPHCDTPLENRKAIKIRMEKGLNDILCGVCEERVELIDLIEQKFASDDFLRTVQQMDAEAQINIDNESLELILVGHAFSIAGEAGQIFRPTPNSDWGIDGEIEFKNDKGQASGKRVYLQLKHGDSYLRTRKSDGAEIFQIKNPRWAEYWQAHEYPVMLVIRTSNGQIRWMNVTDYLREHGKKTKQIIFDGEPFTALNVVNLRNEELKKER